MPPQPIFWRGKNEFGKIDNKAVLASSDHFFYVGVYITLGKKAAYDVSNF